MKSLVKKSGIAAAAALLILSVMLVTGCTGPETESSRYTPPVGMGAVRLNFNKNINRASILPGDLTFGDFEEFDFVFTPITDGASKKVENIVPLDIYDPIDLVPGTYKLDVIAKIDSLPVATGSITNFQINVNTLNDSLTVVLKVYEPEAGEKGIFSYKIITSSLANQPTDALMQLTKIGSLGTDDSIDLLDPDVLNKSTFTDLEVETGYYYLDFILTVTGDTVTFRHIIHIYQNITNSFTITFDNDNYFNVRTGRGKFDSGDITFENPIDTEITVELEDGDETPITNTINLSLTGNSGDQTITIKITNDDAFDSYEWYCKGVELTADGPDHTFTVDTSKAPFNDVPNKDSGLTELTYQLTVTGIKGGKPYSTTIDIVVDADE